MFLFQVSERFKLSSGLVLLPGLAENFVPAGTSITIVRPDKTEIETEITSIFFGSNHITIGKSITVDDVPIGSEVWAKKSITYDLTHYNLTEKKLVRDTCEITFQHKIDQQFFMLLKLSGVAGIIDYLDENKIPAKLRIDRTTSSFGIDLALQFKNEEIKTYPEVLLFLDKDCVYFAFRSIAKEITYFSKRHQS